MSISECPVHEAMGLSDQYYMPLLYNLYTMMSRRLRSAGESLHSFGIIAHMHVYHELWAEMSLSPAGKSSVRLAVQAHHGMLLAQTCAQI